MTINNDTPVKKTISLYSSLGWKSLFARIRFWDAPYKQAEEMVPESGVVVELGCGEGLFSNYIAIRSKNRKIFGIDSNIARIRQADRKLPNASFISGDATKIKIPAADAIVLMHLLHHLSSYEEQEKLLRKCCSRLKKKGKLIIVEIEPKLSLKYLIVLFVDHFLVAWLFQKKLYSAIYFRKKNEWLSLLVDLGFKVNSYPADENKPFPHIIFECIKR